MPPKRTLKISAIVLLTLLCIASTAYGAILWNIHKSAQQYCSIAQQAHPHPGNNIAALIEYMNSDTHSLQQRNLAVWTLGRLKNPAALQALKSAYTAKQCNHNTQLCQYELQKAIKRCTGKQ